MIAVPMFVYTTWVNADAFIDASDKVILSAETNPDEDSLTFKMFQEAEYDMLCLIAHFEGVKVYSYWDPYGKCYTIGIGNTVRPDGKKVTSKDRIHDKEELMEYFKQHVETYIYPDMQKYLPLAEMTTQEIAALGSLFYNCGSGILHEKNGAPTYMADVIGSYFTYKNATDSVEIAVEGSNPYSYKVDMAEGLEFCKKELTSLMDKKVYAKGKKLDVLIKRRYMEEKILFNEIIMDNTGEFSLENSVNFAEQPLGAAYSIPMNDFADNTLVCDSINNCAYGRNLADSIEYAFNHPNKVTYKRTVKRKVRRR